MKKQVILKNAVRTMSGVTPVAILTKPYPCPGRCIYCPSESNTPKSYLTKEPATARAILNKYSPYDQVICRLNQYQRTGHPTQKIELIILGGSWSAYTHEYQNGFLMGVWQALNGETSVSYEEAITKNETAYHRMIGLSIETRPDLITEQEIKRLRNLGITKVEMGVQTVDDKILALNQREHGIDKTIAATKLLKDAGFKVLYHIMPGLYGSSPAQDLAVFQTLFSDEHYQPDMLKIYPCVVVPGTKLYELYKNGDYTPYTTAELIDLLLKIKSTIPPYVRIMRLFRDIPAEYVAAGSTISNLREVLKTEMYKRKTRCNCIRCREIRNEKQEKDLKLVRIDYPASGGKEIFWQYVDLQDRIYALLRLRIPSTAVSENEPVFKVLHQASLIREVHVFGSSTPLAEKGKVQHRGLGKKLIALAENITLQEFNLKRIAVISGIGVREYYRKLGYELKQTYMVKNLV